MLWRSVLVPERERSCGYFLQRKFRQTLPENPFESGEETRLKTWEHQQRFHQEDIQGSMKIVLSNLTYVDTKNLKFVSRWRKCLQMKP